MANERAIENHAGTLPKIDVNGLHGPVRILAGGQLGAPESARRWRLAKALPRTGSHRARSSAVRLIRAQAWFAGGRRNAESGIAIAAGGTVIGAMFAGIPSERRGRLACLRALAICYFVSALGCALAWNWRAFLLCRVIGGLAIGSSVIGPMYIAEIAPAAKRGRPVGLFQTNRARPENLRGRLDVPGSAS